MSEIRHNLGGRFERREIDLPTGPLGYFVGGDGPSFLHLHGAGGLRVSQALQDLTDGYRVYLPFIPGFDGTPFHEELNSFPQLADAMAALVEEEIGTPCPVNGHAFGARFALWYAVLHGDKLDHAIIQCPSGLRPKPRAMSDAQYIKDVVSHPERVPDENRPEAVVEANRAAGHRYHTPGKGIVKSTHRDQALIDRLGEIDCLMLILQGSQDAVLRPESVEFLASQVPRSRLVFVAEAGHLIEIDQPKGFVSLVREFLTRGEAFILERENSGAGTSTGALDRA